MSFNYELSHVMFVVCIKKYWFRNTGWSAAWMLTDIWNTITQIRLALARAKLGGRVYMCMGGISEQRLSKRF